MSLFSTIGLFTKPNDTRVDKTLQQLHEDLNQQGFRLLADQNAGLILGLPSMATGELARRIDLAIVVGGDGTLLGAGRLLAAYNVPIIGVNLTVWVFWWMFRQMRCKPNSPRCSRAIPRRTTPDAARRSRTRR